MENNDVIKILLNEYVDKDRRLTKELEKVKKERDEHKLKMTNTVKQIQQHKNRNKRYYEENRGLKEKVTSLTKENDSFKKINEVLNNTVEYMIKNLLNQQHGQRKSIEDIFYMLKSYTQKAANKKSIVHSALKGQPSNKLLITQYTQQGQKVILMDNNKQMKQYQPMEHDPKQVTLSHIQKNGLNAEQINIAIEISELQRKLEDIRKQNQVLHNMLKQKQYIIDNQIQNINKITNNLNLQKSKSQQIIEGLKKQMEILKIIEKEKRETELLELKKTLSDQFQTQFNNKMEDLTKQLNEMHSSQIEIIITSKDDQILNLKNKFQYQEQELKSLNNKLKLDQQNQLEILKNKINDQDNKLKVQEVQLKNQDDKLKIQENQLKIQEHKIKFQEDSLRAQQDKLKAQQAMIEEDYEIIQTNSKLLQQNIKDFKQLTLQIEEDKFQEQLLIQGNQRNLLEKPPNQLILLLNRLKDALKKCLRDSEIDQDELLELQKEIEKVNMNSKNYNDQYLKNILNRVRTITAKCLKEVSLNEQDLESLQKQIDGLIVGANLNNE